MTRRFTPELSSQRRRIDDMVGDSKYSYIADYLMAFRDSHDNCVMVYSPYLGVSQYEQIDGKHIGYYTITVTDFSIYGEGKKAIVVSMRR